MPDILFPSDNEYGVPTLLLEAALPAVELPVVAWGSRARTVTHRKRDQPGGWHFYVDDYRFSGLWAKPHLVPGTRYLWAAEPNYSIFDQTPVAQVIRWTYQKRWLARYWQSQGLRTVVDLNVPTHLQHWNLLGVPAGWSAFSARGYSDDPQQLREQHALARQVSGRRNPLFLVVGGGRAIATWCQRTPGVIHAAYPPGQNVYSRLAGPAISNPQPSALNPQP